MRYENVAIPAGFAWSSPFTKWQGSLAEVSSLDLAADVTARALAERQFDPGQLRFMSVRSGGRSFVGVALSVAPKFRFNRR